MGFAVATILLFVGILQHRNRKTWVSPDVFFCYEWSLISFLATLQLYGMYSASSTTWLIILIGSITFVIGVNLARRFKFKSYNSLSVTSMDNIGMIKFQSKEKRLFWITLFVLYVLASKEFMQSIRLMMSGTTLDSIRLMSYGIMTSDNYVRNTGLIAEISDAIIAAIEKIIEAMGIQIFVIDTKKNFNYLLSVCGLVLIHSFSDGGRFGIVYLIIAVVVCYTLYIKAELIAKIQITRKTKKKVARIVFLLAGTIVIITLIRGAVISDLFKKYYRYLCGNVVFFDLHVDKLSNNNFWSLGFAGFYGLWAWILPIFHNLFGLPYPQIYLDTIDTVMDGQNFLKIGKEMYTNAFITPFYQIFADYRWIGLVLGMLLLGYVTGRAYIRTKSFDRWSIVFYLVIVQMVFKTLQVYPFASKEYMMFFIVFGGLSILKKVKIK